MDTVLYSFKLTDINTLIDDDLVARLLFPSSNPDCYRSNGYVHIFEAKLQPKTS